MSEIHIPLSTLRRVYKYAERNHITGMEAVASYVDSEKLATRAAELERENERLLTIARGLVEYRRRNTLNFQLEKADYFISMFDDILKHKASERIE